MLVKMVVEYCQFVDDIPTATPDILSRLIELLKVGIIGRYIISILLMIVLDSSFWYVMENPEK